MRVKDLMSSAPKTIGREASLKTAKEAMLEHKVRRLPVMDGSILVGIITKEDILAASPSVVDFVDQEELKERLENTTVEEIMTEDPYTVESEAPIEKAAGVMREKKIGGLPVLMEGKLVGIITETDIFRAFVQIIGITTDSMRFEFEFDDAWKTLETVRAGLEKQDLDLSSLLVVRGADGRRHMVVRGTPKQQ